MGGLGQHLTAEFFNWVHAVHVKVLPLNEDSDIRVWTDLNPDYGTGLLELHAPLVYGVGSQGGDRVSYCSDGPHSPLRGGRTVESRTKEELFWGEEPSKEGPN